MDDITCLEKAYVRLRYFPPLGAREEPVDCKLVVLVPGHHIYRPPYGMVRPKGDPYILRDAWDDGLPTEEPIGYELLCDTLSLEGEGAIILILQCSTYINFQTSFISKRNQSVTEQHHVYVSLPVMYKLPGSHILISRWMPLNMRLAHICEALWAAFSKIDEVDKVLDSTIQLQKGVCPSDIKIFETALRLIEQNANEALKNAIIRAWVKYPNGQPGPIVMQMIGKRFFHGQLAGISSRSGTVA
jgi:hypothetical protein